MSRRRLLLLSNSRNHGEESLAHAEGWIKSFLGDIDSVVFVPYAGVTVPFGQYSSFIRERFASFGFGLESVSEVGNPREALAKARAIVVGGGNTFHLLKHVYEHDLVGTIRDRVTSGVPYIGWSAGSNLACPTIRTTNDMPIVQPPSFDATGLVPFQINPHYMDTHPAGHQGETREQRILEFIEANPDMYVVGLREGSALKVQNSAVELLGEKAIRLFRKGIDAREYHSNESMDFLLG